MVFADLRAAFHSVLTEEVFGRLMIFDSREAARRRVGFDGEWILGPVLWAVHENGYSS